MSQDTITISSSGIWQGQLETPGCWQSRARNGNFPPAFASISYFTVAPTSGIYNVCPVSSRTNHCECNLQYGVMLRTAFHCTSRTAGPLHFVSLCAFACRDASAVCGCDQRACAAVLHVADCRFAHYLLLGRCQMQIEALRYRFFKDKPHVCLSLQAGSVGSLQSCGWKKTKHHAYMVCLELTGAWHRILSFGERVCGRHFHTRSDQVGV